MTFQGAVTTSLHHNSQTSPRTCNPPERFTKFYTLLLKQSYIKLSFFCCLEGHYCVCYNLCLWSMWLLFMVCYGLCLCCYIEYVMSISEWRSLHDSVQQRCTACCTERFLLTSVKCWGWELSVVTGDGDTEKMTVLGQGPTSISFLILHFTVIYYEQTNKKNSSFN